MMEDRGRDDGELIEGEQMMQRCRKFIFLSKLFSSVSLSG